VTERRLRVAAAVLAAAGIAVSGYLLWVREAGATLICSTGGCETVQTSPYADVLGIPVALVGLVGYLLLLATAVGAGETARSAHAVLALAAAVFSTYLLYVQLDLIGAVCDWCLVSDGIVSGIAVLALLRVKVAQESSAVSSRSPAASA
jgi:uncharacterized membrane protein